MALEDRNAAREGRFAASRDRRPGGPALRDLSQVSGADPLTDLGYVWDTTAPAGTIVQSPSVGAVTYVVVRSGPADAGRWLTETRNVYQDYKQIYGEEPPEEIRLVSLAIDPTTPTRSPSRSSARSSSAAVNR